MVNKQFITILNTAQDRKSRPNVGRTQRKRERVKEKRRKEKVREREREAQNFTIIQIKV